MRDLHPFIRVVRALSQPARMFRAFRVRAEIGWLLLTNRLGRSPVTTVNQGVVVSLTTYGMRLQSVHLTIESIARGQLVPSRLILWINDTEAFANLPKPLRRLRRRGLEIMLCNNYGPHTKYYPYVASQEFFVEPLVTADDDIIYPRSWLARLVAEHAQYPNCVSCYRARVVLLRGCSIAPYREWPLCESTESSYRAMATGVSGVIYPAALLDELKRTGAGFVVRCPKADDLWLHVQAIRSGFPIRQIGPEAVHFPMIPGTQKTTLWSENWEDGDGNDRQSP